MDPAALAQSSPEEQAIFLAALLEGPALEPPLGASSNFDHPGGSHAIGYGVVLLGSIVAALAVLLRLWSRALLKTFRIEDALLISALVSISVSRRRTKLNRLQRVYLLDTHMSYTNSRYSQALKFISGTSSSKICFQSFT